MAPAPRCVPTGTSAPVSVADGPCTIGRRLPRVDCNRVATPIATRQKLISSALWSGDIPMAAAMASGSTKGEMSTNVCCQPYSNVSHSRGGRSSIPYTSLANSASPGAR